MVEVLKDKTTYALQIKEMLVNKTFTTSEYKKFIIFEGKSREISKLPFFPDRIIHHLVIGILDPILTPVFTSNTYSCIKGRGIHKASFKLREYLKNDVEGTKYCLKLDIKKFYPNVNIDILKMIIRRKIKDKDLLWLIDDILESSEGLPIGSFTSQLFGNLYLTYFDHWVKEELGIKYYLRYADDIVILSESKYKLHFWLDEINQYLYQNLGLIVKDNHQVFPVSSRGINWTGYVHYHTHTLIRKTIKKNYIRGKIKKNWYGWLKHGDCVNLIRKYESKVK